MSQCESLYLPFTKSYKGHHVEKVEVGRECSTLGKG